MKITRRELVRRLSAIYGAGAVGTAIPIRALAQDAAAAGTDAAMMAAMDAGTVMWDGPSGVSNTHYNWGVRLPWKNAGGDWVDASNVPQGAARFATISWSAAGAATANVSTLVGRWYAGGNKGLYLKCLSNAAHVAARLNADASIRPVIVATLSDGSAISLPCSGSAVCNSTAFYPVYGPTLSIQSFSSLVLQFSLPPLSGRTVTSAILRLVTTRLYGGPVSCAIFELDPPKIFDGGTPVPGVAAKYNRDEGIERDPQVYFATQFDDPDWQKKHFPAGHLASDAVVVGDAELGTPAIRATYHKGEFSPCTLNHMWSQRVAGGTRLNAAGTLKTFENIHPTQYDALYNQDCPLEVYFRYYVKLAADYQCDVEGKKLPGLAGRYGYWNWSGPDSGYYQVVNGNGQSPTKGTKVLESQYPGGFYYSGWSMRHHAAVGPSDANPYGGWVAASTYGYHVGMQNSFGDAWRWGTPDTGWVNFEPDRWYCIEQYVKMNSLSGPFDALGNGTGNADGIIRGWVDGVLVFEKSDLVFRRHPAIRVDEVWLDHYHGGTIPPEGPHGFSMANIVVANAYIGPMTTGGPVVVAPPPVTKAPGPAWLAGKPLNQWIAIAGTEMSKAALTAQAAVGLTDALGRNLGYGDPRKGIFAYSGGALKRSGSEMLLFGGGANGAWAGNDVRGLRLEDAAPAWQTRVAPTPAAKVRPRSSTRSPYMLDGISPNARHSYWGPQFNDAQDLFIVFGCVHAWSGGQFLTVDGAPLSTGKWKTPGSHPNVPLMRGWDGNWTCKHPVTEDVYVAGAQGVSKWQASLNRWSIFWLGTRTDIDRGVAAIDPTGGGTLLRVGASGVTLALDLATGVATDGRLGGSFGSAIKVGDYYAAGMVFDVALGKFVLFQDDGHLYTISKVSASSWAVERMVLTGVGPETLHSSGGYTPAIWGRMQYVPNLKGICIIQAYDRPAYFVKTA